MQNYVYTIAKVCQQFGVENVVICPGSRSAPLVYAFTENNHFKCFSVIDERSAGFMALGIAQQTLKPVVLISTSGTACLNFFPAIAEAFYQKIPLLVLSADRPPSLLNQQDGQMIMQKNVFGKHVKGSHELLCFEEDKIDYFLIEQIVFQALDESMLEQGFGPVHINVPLREPLYNKTSQALVPELIKNNEIKIRSANNQFPLIEELKEAWKASEKRLILIGQMPPSEELAETLQYICQQEDVVVFSDIVSNQQATSNVPLFDAIIQFHSEEILQELAPDLIISFGGPFVSKAMKNWLKASSPKYHFRIQLEDTLINTYQNVTHFIKADLLSYLSTFRAIRIFNNPKEKPYGNAWQKLNANAAMAITQFHHKQFWCEPTVTKKLLNILPKNSQLQIGNSSSVRWVSWNGFTQNELSVYCNRGTSGIDGTISTAIGAAIISPEKTITLLCGDLSLFYDQNGFWQQELPANLKIVVLNNHGGNIFNWIDGPSQHPEQLPYFTTKNNLSIELLAKQYGLVYQKCENFEELSNSLLNLYTPQTAPIILDIVFDETSNLNAIKAFKGMKLA